MAAITPLQADLLGAVRDCGPDSGYVERTFRERNAADLAAFGAVWDECRAKRWLVSEYLHCHLTERGKAALKGVSHG